MAKKLFDRIPLEKWAALLHDIKLRVGEQWGPNSKYTNDEVVAAIKNFVKDKDRLPTSDELEKGVLGFSSSIFYTRCKSLLNVATILGIPYEPKKRASGKKNKAKAPKKATEPAKPIRINSSMKEEYLDAVTILAEAKGSWEFTSAELRQGFLDLIGSYDMNIIRHFWKNGILFLDEAKKRFDSKGVSAPATDTVAKIEQTKEVSAPDSMPRAEESKVVSAPHSEIVDLAPNQVVPNSAKSSAGARTTSISSEASHTKPINEIVIRVNGNIDLNPIIKSVAEFTDKVVIEIS